MASRNRRVQDGLSDAREAARVAATELREARASAGLSQAAAARAAGMSAAQWGRIERNELESPDLVQLSVAARVLGLRASVKFYPVGLPIRDAPQLALLRRFRAVLGAPLILHAEVGLPTPGDLRAWDAVITGADAPFVADLETHVADAQAIERRLRLKQRDDPRATLLLLVLLRSDHHRRFLAEHREVFRDLLPLDSAPVLHALRSGRRPPNSGIVLL